MIRVYAILIVLGLLGGAVYGVKYYYDDTQQTIATLNQANASYKAVVDSQTNAIKEMKANAERQQELISKLNNDLSKAEEDVDRLRHTLSNHDLTLLASKKPGLIESRINNAVKELFEDIESITSTD